MSLHRYLTRLIWVCVLPLLLLVMGLSVFRLSHLQQEDVREAASLAKNVVNAVDEGLNARAGMDPPDRLYYQNLLDRMVLPPGWSIELRDVNGSSMARRAPPGMVADPRADSPRRFVAASNVLPWSVAVEMSAGAAHTPWVRASAALAAAILIATLTAVLGGKWASRRLALSVVSLTQLPATAKSAPDITEIATVRRLLANSQAARRQAEAELAQHQTNLEQLVATRTDELATAKQVSDAANHVKSEFLATMSHELRTPLNAVMGLARLLGDSPLSRRQRDYTDKIQSSAQALRTLIDDILDFSKIEADQLHLESVPFSLDAILRTTATVMGVGIAGKPIEILFQVAPDVPDEMLGDAVRLQQILLNLTDNAVKFTDKGSIVVSVRCLRQSNTQVTLQVSVHDTGIGIPAAQLASIFEGFNQATQSTNRLYGGTGLGLSISVRLAQLMGGQITVDSTVDLGSEFCLEVPLALAQHAATTAAAVVRPALRLLIIDDNPMARDVLAQTCTDLGWLVTAVDCGAAGLEELRQSAHQGRDYDVMLLDWRMPGMDGLEMLRHAYSTPDVGLAPVVLMVGAFEMEKALAASDDLHIEAIVSKPTTPTRLQEALKRAYAGEPSVPPTESRPADQRLGGLRLLVAEDNVLNQEVVSDILTRSGAEVVLVDHGLAAVNALRTPDARFDAVLMDIQMPVMDGYTATRIIREELGLTDLPIIAVTAFSRSQDREKSRAAGMVGHIVKPLNVEDLLDLVARDRRGAPRQAMPTGEHAPLLPGLDVAAALESFGADTARYKELLRKFMAQHGHDTEEARTCFNAQDTQGAANLLHGLSGIAKLLQANALGSLASDAENAIADGNTEAMPALWDALQAAMQTLAHSIDRFTAR